MQIILSRCRYLSPWIRLALDSATSVNGLVINLALPYHNVQNPLDVTHDGPIAADDVLQIINDINAHGSGPVSFSRTPKYYYDANTDGNVAADDIITVINFINANPNRDSEGEALSGVLSAISNLDTVYSIRQAQSTHNRPAEGNARSLVPAE